MPAFGLTFFLKQAVTNVGCSETYFVDVADYDAATAEAGLLLLDRVGILCDTWAIVYSRISLPTVAGDSVVSFANTPGENVGTSVDPWSALLTRLEAGELHRGRKFLHGVPEGAFNADGSYNPANGSAAAFDTYFDRTKTAPYQLKAAGPTFIDVTNHIPLRMASHRIGRPFGLQVGRRRSPAGP